MYKIRNILVMLASIVALIGAASLIIFITNKRVQQPPVSPVSETSKEIISYDSVKEISFSAADISDKSSLSSKLSKEARSYSAGVIFFKTDTELKNIFTILSPSIPPLFLRSIEKSFFGAFGPDNFIILKTDSYERSYAGMLEWESFIGKDILPMFFEIVPVSPVVFKDKVVENKDTRVAVDEKGNTLFVYGFYDSKTIIVSRNEETFKQVYAILLRQSL